MEVPFMILGLVLSGVVVRTPDWKSAGCEFKYQHFCFWKGKFSLILNRNSEKHELWADYISLVLLLQQSFLDTTVRKITNCFFTSACQKRKKYAIINTVFGTCCYNWAFNIQKSYFFWVQKGNICLFFSKHTIQFEFFGNYVILPDLPEIYYGRKK